MKVYAWMLALLLFAAPAVAADVDGKWAGALDTPNGPVNIFFTFKADGKSLTGSMTGQDGSEIAIKDGTVDGGNIAFRVNIDFGGMPLEISYKGVVSPAEIKMTLDFMGMPFDFLVKKAP